MTFTLSNIPSNTQALAAYQRRQSTFDATTMVAVKCFEFLGLLAQPCGLQAGIIFAINHAAAYFASTTTRTQQAIGTLAVRKLKKTIATLSFQMSTGDTASRAGEGVVLFIQNELILGQAIWQSALRTGRSGLPVQSDQSLPDRC